MVVIFLPVLSTHGYLTSWAAFVVSVAMLGVSVGVKQANQTFCFALANVHASSSAILTHFPVVIVGYRVRCIRMEICRNWFALIVVRVFHVHWKAVDGAMISFYSSMGMPKLDFNGVENAGHCHDILWWLTNIESRCEGVYLCFCALLVSVLFVMRCKAHLLLFYVAQRLQELIAWTSSCNYNCLLSISRGIIGGVKERE
jgi:hypothetical protein